MNIRPHRPAETRSIFTWGHPINDYRRYIANIARLKINQLIVWNDFLPINAKDIVDYAHEYGIELIWGYAWGWGTDCKDIDLNNLDTLRKEIVEVFLRDYDKAGDGIYFQSFTEMQEDHIGDTLVAEAVSDLCKCYILSHSTPAPCHWHRKLRHG